MAKPLYVLLGSNLGNRDQMISRANDRLVTALGKVRIKSAIYTSDAWGIKNQAVFLNQVICFDTDKKPQNILAICKQIEKDLGRKKTIKWEAREIDIDILYYGDIILKTTALTIPHKALLLRRFALLPLVEIAPNFKHPEVGLSNADLLTLCIDKGHVAHFEPENEA